ncbi:MAG: translational GTPase TypA [Chloroflexi bacterium]|nr:translational GTPase TypA [Chloroflexota bacterium]
MSGLSQNHIRNVAIVAHVDHGKTTLVDAMLKYSHVFRDNQEVGELIMDSNPQERERGITILSKNTALTHGDVTVNIIDTPGHADFSGEVERVVNMADGCLLIVDAVEGPMPQTRYVLKTALGQGLKPIVVINKIDRPMTRIPQVIDEIQNLFLELATDANQLDFPILFASAKAGYAMAKVDDEPKDLAPLFDAIVNHIPAPIADTDGPLQMLTAALDFDNHLGQIAVGRIFRGVLKRNAPIAVIAHDGTTTQFKADHVFVFRDLARNEVDEVSAGDIAAVSGIRDIVIGDTIADPAAPEALGRIVIEDPTVQMTFGVNTSPFSGKEGKYATSRMLWDRLQRELQTNVSLRVERTDSADEFLVAGRGELHLSVLIESMRREGLELQVSKPEAITKRIDGVLNEPYEKLTVDTREEFIGAITEELASRLGQMADMVNDGQGNIRLEYALPTRGLIGFRSFFLRATRGNGVISSEFTGNHPVKGQVKSTRSGVIVASETGTAVTYGIRNAQERGETFVEPQTAVYQGMIVGMHPRDRDLDLNICRERKITNMRSATSEIVLRLEPAIKFSLEEALDFVATDELVEVTPKNVRLRKRVLQADQRYRDVRAKSKSA